MHEGRGQDSYSRCALPRAGVVDLILGAFCDGAHPVDTRDEGLAPHLVGPVMCTLAVEGKRCKQRQQAQAWLDDDDDDGFYITQNHFRTRYCIKYMCCYFLTLTVLPFQTSRSYQPRVSRFLGAKTQERASHFPTYIVVLRPWG